VWLPLHRQLQQHYKLVLPTGEVAFIDRGSYDLMRWMQARTRPGDNFFDDDGVAFYLKLRNPTHVEFVNNDQFTSPLDVAEVLAAIANQPPRYIALFPGTPETPYDHAGPFRSYVHSKYCLAQTFLISPRKFSEEIWGDCAATDGVR
jgi:hypothetical protein